MSENQNNYIDVNQMVLNTNGVNCNKMRESLIAIAQEVLLFHNPRTNVASPNLTSNEEIFNKLIKSKYSLAFKRKMIKQLKEKVATACTVAQTAISAGENESTSLNDHLHLARNECADLYQKHRQTSQIIQTMSNDNKLLRDELGNLYNFIELGYSELQKINNACLVETSITQQLKHIIVCCGQYFADFNNEHERNLQLSQKNRFLNSKIKILNNSLEAMSEDLKNLRRQNVRLKKENNMEKTEKVKPKSKVPIPLEFHKSYMNTRKLKIDFIRESPELDITIHLTIIKKLLRDQDDLLTDLKSLSKEVISDETP